jgi:DNA topoisomerase-1
MWNTLYHYGPFFIQESHFHPSNNLNTKLSPVQLYLIQQFVHLKQHHHDKLFVSNFWKSLSHHHVNLIHKFNLQIPQVSFHANIPSFYKTIHVNGKQIQQKQIIPEMPHIFIGRGNHPLRGTCKFLIKPHDITINISLKNNEKFIHHLKSKGVTHIVENKQANWLFSWKDSITHENKYVYFHDNVHSNDVLKKFDIARELKQHLHKLHRTQNTFIKSNDDKKQQLALVIYLIEHHSIRVGNEKDTDLEADTVGACSLTKKNIQHIQPSNRSFQLTFFGKDYIPFSKKIILPPEYFQAFYTLYSKNKKTLFYLISPSTVNYFLQKIMDNLTAKVFRTYNASKMFQSVLNEYTHIDPKQRILLANKQVAKLCNHKKFCTKTKQFIPALNTSRKNYIDPRIYFAFCKKHKLTPSSTLFHGNFDKFSPSSFVF